MLTKTKEIFESISNIETFFIELQNSLEKENRFFPDDKLNVALKELLRCKSASLVIEKGTILYRGRIYDKSKDNLKGKPLQFKGYDAEGSTINKSDQWPKTGRMNPEGIWVLYVSTGEKTCAKELGTAANEEISIAQMQVQKDLKIVDFPKLARQVRNPKKKEFANLINTILSSGYGGRTYVFPQYLAMYCKYLKYDGIMYRSKYANKNDNQTGMNIAIFDYTKCIPISSEVKRVKKVTLEFEK